MRIQRSFFVLAACTLLASCGGSSCTDLDIGDTRRTVPNGEFVGWNRLDGVTRDYSEAVGTGHFRFVIPSAALHYHRKRVRLLGYMYTQDRDGTFTIVPSKAYFGHVTPPPGRLIRVVPLPNVRLPALEPRTLFSIAGEFRVSIAGGSLEDTAYVLEANNVRYVGGEL